MYSPDKRSHLNLVHPTLLQGRSRSLEVAFFLFLDIVWYEPSLLNKVKSFEQSGGNLSQTLKAGLIAGATAFAFAGIGPTPSLAANPVSFAEHVIADAAVGCASSVASGGGCASGALSAGIGGHCRR
jgi:hypothetical protein